MTGSVLILLLLRATNSHVLMCAMHAFTVRAFPVYAVGRVSRSVQIPAAPKREKIALQLAEKASKAHRAKKQNALKEVTRNFAA